jgi:hypothetical protein
MAHQILSTLSFPPRELHVLARIFAIFLVEIALVLV